MLPLFTAYAYMFIIGKKSKKKIVNIKNKYIKVKTQPNTRADPKTRHRVCFKFVLGLVFKTLRLFYV